jgi:hypothetical protein
VDYPTEFEKGIIIRPDDPSVIYSKKRTFEEKVKIRQVYQKIFFDGIFIGYTEIDLTKRGATKKHYSALFFIPSMNLVWAEYESIIQ